MKDKCKRPVAASNGLKVVTRTRKRVKFSKLNIHYGDGAKYMSYIKVWCSFNVIITFLQKALEALHGSLSFLLLILNHGCMVLL